MSLTYEDCKELRDHGFPGSEDWAEPTPEVLYAGYQKTQPSLSELIEECYDYFDSLHNYEGDWICYGGDKKGDGLSVTGSSPEIAVKNLYCALNPKK